MKPIALVILFIFLASPWFVNVARLANCDFESDYRCEVAHGIGVFVPPASWITVWFDDDSPKED